jgi:hypothetical protein
MQLADAIQRSRPSNKEKGRPVGADRNLLTLVSNSRVLNNWLTVQLDVQYVQHPNLDLSLNDAWVFGLRFEAVKAWQW